MTSFGSTDIPMTKRSGYRRCASMPFGDSPTCAIRMPNSSILSTTHWTTSVPSGTMSGTPLNMYCTGNSISRTLSASLRLARKKSYDATFCSMEVCGKPIPRSTIPRSVGMVTRPPPQPAGR